MTREELYERVWTRPMTKVSRDFGLSDVGLRKICVKFNVPTPPLGYWAKLAHGKPVKKAALPPAPPNTSSNINLCPSGNLDEPEAITALRAEVTATEAQDQFRVPLEDQARRLHPATAELKRKCKDLGTDTHGFYLSSKGYGPEFKLGQEGMDRGIRILDALAKAELQAQARHDQWSKPSTYSDGTPRTVYPRWDYSPSGKLRLDIYDPHGGRYGRSHEARWVERGSGRIEAKMNDIMATLVVEAEMARQRRLEREDATRQAAEEAERRRIAAARGERIRQVNKLFDEAARKNARLLRLEALRQSLEIEDLAEHQVLAEELNAVINRAREAISAATPGRALADIPELPDPEPEPLYSWQRRY